MTDLTFQPLFPVPAVRPLFGDPPRRRARPVRDGGEALDLGALAEWDEADRRCRAALRQDMHRLYVQQQEQDAAEARRREMLAGRVGRPPPPPAAWPVEMILYSGGFVSSRDSLLPFKFDAGRIRASERGVRVTIDHDESNVVGHLTHLWVDGASLRARGVLTRPVAGAPWGVSMGAISMHTQEDGYRQAGLTIVHEVSLTYRAGDPGARAWLVDH